ncbi:MAG: hypothetical protein OK438_04065 [Thaumarchaeota archaeon]|nr:hypothetical protein [Nitrososphaerota archaeon]
MPSTHSWHEAKTVLLALGYHQTITKDERVIYVSGEDKVVLQKSNKLDVAYILILCNHLDMKYIDFLKIYQREYERVSRDRQASKRGSAPEK